MNIRRAVLLVVVVCVFGSAAFGQPWAGNGVEGDPYLIYDACDMQAIGADANYWDAHFKLMADIDLSAYTGTSFNIIGDDVNAFTGVFDGNGHTISNFTYDSGGVNFMGFFRSVDGSNAEVKNLGLLDPNLSANNSYCVGLLIGYFRNGTLTGCYVRDGNVSGEFPIGGLVGESNGEVSNCSFTGSIDGYESIGGVAGRNGGQISNCRAAGSIYGDRYIGGLIGVNYKTVKNSYATCSILGRINRIGGLVGSNSAGEILNCYAIGTVEGGSSVGGLVGYSYHWLSVISNCYSSCAVEGGNYTGGLMGYDDHGASYTKCFWDSDVNPDMNGIGNTTDPNVIGESTAEMQIESTFTDAGWDFVGEVINGPNDVWTICEGEDYPRLAWEKYGGGMGTEANPYLIRTSCQMNAIGADSNDWGAHFKLMADIDLGGYTGTQFNIIGPNSTTPFTGVFDGNGHTISNFTYESNDFGFWVGLFGYIDDPCAQVRDLGLVEPCVAGFRDVGAIVGNIERGGVSRCFATGGSVSGTHVTGGLVGANWFGEVVESYSTSDVVGEYEVGGLVGYVEWGSVADCYSCGSVSGFQTVGGLLGENEYGIVVNCYARGEVSGETAVGGLIGYREFAVIEHSFWDVNSSGQASSAGGTGKTTVEMQMESTFTDAGWDFVGEVINGPNDIWDICEGTNYPKFVWQIPAADFVCPDGVNFIDYAFFAEHWLQSIYGECSGVELTGDGKVNWVDFALFAEYWMLTGCGECGGADFTGDENVDLADLYVFATYWLGFEYAEVDLTNDGQVGLDDLREFTDNWLAGL